MIMCRLEREFHMKNFNNKMRENKIMRMETIEEENNEKIHMRIVHGNSIKIMKVIFFSAIVPHDFITIGYCEWMSGGLDGN